MAAKKHSLPFDSRGGVVMIQRRLLKSPSFIGLTPQAKCLMQLMQVHWRNTEPVGFGVREAQRLIPCSRKVAMRCFKELRETGFIVLVDESFFCSRTKSKTRTWRLTWLPFNYGEPSNDWEKADAA